MGFELKPWWRHCIVFFERTLHSPSASLYLGMWLGIGKHSAKPDKMLDGTLRGSEHPIWQYYSEGLPYPCVKHIHVKIFGLSGITIISKILQLSNKIWDDYISHYNKKKQIHEFIVYFSYSWPVLINNIRWCNGLTYFFKNHLWSVL